MVLGQEGARTFPAIGSGMGRLLRFLLPAVFVFVCTGIVAGAAPVRILIVNAGEEPIYSLALAPRPGEWSDDLMPAADVVGIGEARSVALPRGKMTCYYDVRATYRDGHTADRKRVNLCVAERIVFEH